MAINPLIALQGNNASTTFSSVLSNIQGIEKLQQSQAQAPARNQLLQAQADIAQSTVPTAQQTFNQTQKDFSSSVASISRQIIPDLKSGNVDSAIQKLQDRSVQLKEAGLPSENTDKAILLAQNDPNELLLASEAAVIDDQVINPGNRVQFGAQQTFKDSTGNLFFGTTKRDPVTGSIASALVPVSGQEKPIGEVSLVSGLGQTAIEKQGTAVETAGQIEAAKLAEQAITKPKIAGAEEREILKAQRGLLPEVKSAVASALAQSKAVSDSAGKVRSNETALNVYNTAMDGLVKAFTNITTGPGIGLIPAITANQQIADGAVAAMAPVLKQMFRSAGEGIFTDKDQELLLKMVPTRNDFKAARISKISNINSIVQAKLNVPSVGESPQQAPQQNITVDF